MNQLRQAVLTIRQQLGKLGPTERLLIGSFVVILLMALFVVSQYSGKQSMVAILPGVPLADQQKALNFLSASGVKAEMTGGQVTVGADQRESAMALLSANKQLPSDTGSFLKAILSSQSWSHTRQQNDQVYNAAVKGELDRIITSMPGIKSANVIFDVPEATGIGASVRIPTASVAVFTESGAKLSQNTVDAIAYLVGGAKAGLTPERVRVIDGASQRKATNEDDVISSSYLDHVSKVESKTREQLAELLAHIPGVVIAVTASVDVSRVVSHEVRALPNGEGSVSMPRRETTSETEQVDGARGAESGVRSNTGTDPNRGGTGRSSQSKAGEGEKEFENLIGTIKQDKIDPRGMPTMIAISVNVPRSYVVKMITDNDPAAKPDEKSIAAAFEKQVKPAIKESLIPHVRTMTRAANGPIDPKETDQQVVVGLIPIETAPAQGSVQEASLLGGLLGGGSGGGPQIMGMSISQIFDKVVVGGLALGAMGFMLMMLKKAGKKQILPTAEELVGVPPALTRESDLIGEAEESQTALAGIELDDNDVRQSHIRTQVAEMVKSEPENAANLIKQWVVVEE
ncbi:MAG: hypothetical protein AABZ53_03315 [Planctomycetota bacterium]